MVSMSIFRLLLHHIKARLIGTSNMLILPRSTVLLVVCDYRYQCMIGVEGKGEQCAATKKFPQKLQSVKKQIKLFSIQSGRTNFIMLYTSRTQFGENYILLTLRKKEKCIPY